MGFPQLALKVFCTKPVFVEIYKEGRTEDGGPIIALQKELKCNYQSTAKEVVNEKNQKIELTGICIFPGDVAPDLTVIAGGTVTIDGEKRKIYKGSKNYDPDGTVNYTRIEVM